VRTLVLAAWEPELAPLRRLLRRAPAVKLQPVGVGAVDAAVGAARAIAATGARRVIFVGTAGTYDGRGAVGGAAVAGSLRLVSTALLRGDGYAPAPLVADARPTAALGAALRGEAPRLPALAVACPLAITRSAALGRRIAAATGAALENLEAFAVARAAAAAGAEFAAVLGVSNRVGPRAHAEWRAHQRAAADAACRAVARFLTAPSRRASRR
jgi:purine-nucleoside phosphorylase